MSKRIHLEETGERHPRYDGPGNLDQEFRMGGTGPDHLETIVYYTQLLGVRRSLAAPDAKRGHSGWDTRQR